MSEKEIDNSSEELSPTVHVRKKTFVDVLIDRASTTTADVIKNRIAPGIVDLMHDATVGVIDGVFDRGRSSRDIRDQASLSRRASSRSNERGKSTTSFSYDSISGKRNSRTISDVGRRNHDFTEVVFEKRVEAQDVLDRMRSRLEQYDVVSVSDLYSIVGIDDTVQDNQWGWTNLDGSYVRRYRGSFILDLPPTSPLN